MTSPTLGSLAVVGSINVDLTASVDRLPGAGETVLGGTLRRLPGGKGANQAVAAARLGGRVRMIGAVGDDADGQWMLQGLRDAGVDTGGVWLGDSATGTALITVDGAGENQIVVCPGANEDASIGGVEFGQDEAVLAQLEIPLPVVESLGSAVPGFLAINAAPARSLTEALVRRADLIIVNETEFQLQTELAGARLVAVTYGAGGAALREGGREIARSASPRVRVVSSVGAGDAFCAAITLALAAGWSHDDALSAACGVGADAVTHADAQPPLRGLERYRDRPSSHPGR
ncbi:MAG TPA: ribokinase [Microbacterium sp.]|nr:ribokinase [Microbacterium sp.]